MITLVYGGSSSGKSEFAEGLVCATSYENRYYLATMGAKDEESKERIARHRQLRAGKGFVTLEQDVDIANTIPIITTIESGEFTTKACEEGDSIVLLECMSNLVANEMFRDGEVHSATYCVKKIMSDLQLLCSKVSSIVIVSNNVFEDGILYDVGTREYLKALALVNRNISKIADEKYEVVVGIGIKL